MLLMDPRLLGNLIVTIVSRSFNKINCVDVKYCLNRFGLVFAAETCFNSFNNASSLVLSFSIVLSLCKRDTIGAGWAESYHQG